MKRGIVMAACFIGVIAIVLLGCAKEDKQNNSIAVITPTLDYQNDKLIRNAGVGHLLDYQLKVYQADESWVRVWVEGYVDGEKLQEEPLWEISYGNSIHEVEEGPLGVGFIPVDGSYYVYGYTKSVKAPLTRLPDEYSHGKIMGNLGYAAEEKESLELLPGEIRTIGVHWQMGGGTTLRVANFADEEDVMRFTGEHPVVLLVKMQVTKSDGPPGEELPS